MRYFSGKEKKELIQNLTSHYTLDKKDEIIEYSDILFKNKKHFLIETSKFKHKIDETYIPHLKSSEVKELRKITIDTGAVPFLLKGADMMRPGIVKIEKGIEELEIISIIDEVKGLIIGVGLAMYNSQEMEKMNSGKVIQTLHYFKDEYYTIDL